MRPALKSTPLNSLRMLLLLIILLLTAGIFWQAALDIKSSNFAKSDRYNVLLDAKPITLLSLNLPEKTAVAVTFPDDLYVPVAYGYGSYKMSSVYSVGMLDKRGQETLVATVENYLGVPLDGYFRVNREIRGSPKNFFLSPAILSAQSSVSLFDKIRLFIALFQLQSSRLQTIDLNKFAQPLVLADGTTAEAIDADQLDQKLSALFFENNIREEGKRVEVINTTNRQGVGNKLARMLTQIGSSVISLSTQDLNLASCQVQAEKDAINSIIVRKMQKIFSCQIVERGAGKASVRLLLGEKEARRVGW